MRKLMSRMTPLKNIDKIPVALIGGFVAVLAGVAVMGNNSQAEPAQVTQSASRVDWSKPLDPDDPALQARVAEVNKRIAASRTTGATSATSPKPIKRQWTYRAYTDEMTGETIHIAEITSENTMNFRFPYGGPQRGEITIRMHPQHGKDVIFSIEQGQLLCDKWSGLNRRCPVRVRFDEESPAAWTASPAADHSTEHLFFRDYGEFVQRLRGAEVIRIQPNVYQNGAPVFEFNAADFDMDRYLGK